MRKALMKEKGLAKASCSRPSATKTPFQIYIKGSCRKRKRENHFSWAKASHRATVSSKISSSSQASLNSTNWSGKRKMSWQGSKISSTWNGILTKDCEFILYKSKGCKLHHYTLKKSYEVVSTNKVMSQGKKSKVVSYGKKINNFSL